MNKLLVITVLVALLSINAQSFRVARQAEGEEPETVVAEEPAEEPAEGMVDAPEMVPEAVPEVEPEVLPEVVPEVVPEVPAMKGTLGRISDTFIGYYDSSINTASGYLESIRGMKLEEKAKNLFDDTTRAMSTYAGILQDQLYHVLYPQQ